MLLRGEAEQLTEAQLLDAYVRRKQWEAELAATMQAKVLTEAWVASDFAKQLSEHVVRLHAHEMWRLVLTAFGVKNVPPSILFAGSNGDGLRRASGPGSFEAAYQAALREKQAKEAQQE